MTQEATNAVLGYSEDLGIGFFSVFDRNRGSHGARTMSGATQRANIYAMRILSRFRTKSPQPFDCGLGPGGRNARPAEVS